MDADTRDEEVRRLLAELTLIARNPPSDLMQARERVNELTGRIVALNRTPALPWPMWP